MPPYPQAASGRTGCAPQQAPAPPSATLPRGHGEAAWPPRALRQRAARSRRAVRRGSAEGVAAGDARWRGQPPRCSAAPRHDALPKQRAAYWTQGNAAVWSARSPCWTPTRQPGQTPRSGAKEMAFLRMSCETDTRTQPPRNPLCPGPLGELHRCVPSCGRDLGHGRHWWEPCTVARRPSEGQLAPEQEWRSPFVCAEAVSGTRSARHQPAPDAAEQP
mmetsp:Transcript_61488/g.164507  ORF Transcript_61488/g.164507 Transcript_61488/m.164507 type:complete len:218 (+) Transcript_61488:366-1019(+)